MDENADLSRLIRYQIDQMFMTTLKTDKPSFFDGVVEKAVKKTKACAEKMGGRTNVTSINPYHAVMYCNLLYWISHELSIIGEKQIADMVYYLNKSLNCVELFHEVNLPNIWYCEHPLGSILGRAKYHDYFFFYQGCTVGGNFRRDGSIVYPEIGEHVKMLSNSKIIGNSHIGNNVIISANTYIKDQDVPDDVIVFGSSPDLTFAENHFLEGCNIDNVLSR